MNAPQAIAEGEIAREARRVLRKLAARSAVLAPWPGGYAVMLPKKPRPTISVSVNFVEAFQRRGWLMSAPSGFYLPQRGEVASVPGVTCTPMQKNSARAGGGQSQTQPPTRRNFADAHCAGLPRLRQGSGGQERNDSAAEASAKAATKGEVKNVYVLSDAGLGWLRRALAEQDAFAAQHQLRSFRMITDEQGVERLVTVNDGESPLGWLHRRCGSDGKPLIDRAQFEAGERLRRDFTLAQLTPRLAVDFTAPVIGGRRGTKTEAPLPETVLAAKQRVNRALKFAGPGLAELLLDVCCYLIGLEEAEREKGWPKRAGKIVLQIALDRLAQHYGMRGVTGAPSRLRAWHAAEENDT